MARPTNRARIERLFREVGQETGNGLMVPVSIIRAAVTGADSVLMDMVEEGCLFFFKAVAFETSWPEGTLMATWDVD